MVLRRALFVVALAVGACAPAFACSPSYGGGDAAADSGAESAETGPEVDSDPACPSDLPPACPSPAPSFQTEVFGIVQRRCWGCHTDGGVGVSKHELATYAEIYAQRQPVLTQIYQCLMPPADASALAPAERAAMLGWLVCGAPND